MRRHQDEAETIGDFIDAIFDGDASHARDLLEPALELEPPSLALPPCKSKASRRFLRNRLQL